LADLVREGQRDLVVLAADKNIDHGIRGLLSRPRAFGARLIDAESLVHPRHDPGCLREAHNVLRPLLKSYAHALVVFDREGSGREMATREALEAEVEARLAANGLERPSLSSTPSSKSGCSPRLRTWPSA
jgi:hypothetical protein